MKFGDMVQKRTVDSSFPIKGAFNSQVFINGIQEDFGKVNTYERQKVYNNIKGNSQFV